MYRKIIPLLTILLISGCQNQPPINDTNNNQTVESGIVLSDATIEQSNNDGENFWRLRVGKVTYSQDNKNATIEDITANLLQNGEIVLKISAQNGEVINDGEEINLTGEIIAFDTRNEMEIRGEKLYWKPEQNYFTLEENIEAIHTQIRLVTQQAEYNTATQVLQLTEDIVANTFEPQLKILADAIIWQIEQGLISTDLPFEVSRYEDEQITDTLKATTAEMNLNDNILIVENNIEYQSLNPPLQGAGSRMRWDYNNRIVEADKMIRLVEVDEQITMTANQGKVDLTENKVYLSKQIFGESLDNEAKLYADNVIWNLNDQNIDAQGNVVYQQINPVVNFRGNRAQGKLQDKQVTVTGNGNNRVVTTIYP
ncbi:LPS export ABC transporter periplasmic protein LptC [Cyanobacterium stanieri LEGE 03274]|uniref:LPS export ABC transporter periplasmic protein LptC n=1 Tax=Cyanobacterium stanieri LEGE 03274 TaxID=1828756 RepID=A0ABR9V0H1_9CHRO|nr:LPS export ABC transporter periplasmic protein LptC [Cyanobacterium stanieri]MBE9221383.1 LPS export ABC transporter periplasmic protein LptC [Cyanobacterium stanieri LEGE 03274]